MTEPRVLTSGAVVVAVDGSAASRAALSWAGCLGAPIRVVRSWTYPSTIPLPWSRLSSYSPEEVDDTVRTELELVVEEVLGDVDAAEIEVLRGPPAAALITHVSTTRAPHLVVGARGLGGFTGLLLGSVSRHCLEHAACSVTVVPGPERAVTPPGVSTIVVGLDGSTLSTRALDHAVELAQRIGATVVPVHAFDPSFVELPPEVAIELRVAVERRVRDQCGDRMALPAMKDCRVIDGDARQVLFDVATATQADLIVVGAVGAGTIQKPLGPVATHLGQHAMVPVTVVR
jgi:nucleotide-binding universal stress UspA family protein